MRAIRDAWWAILLFGIACLLIFVSAAHAGFDSPTHHRTLIQEVNPHCSKLSNPIECSHLSRPHVKDPLKDEDKCQRDRDLYMYHHGLTGKPDDLKGLHGCAMYAHDAAYHRLLAHVPDTLQEMIEYAAGSLGLTPSELGQAALTATPQQ